MWIRYKAVVSIGSQYHLGSKCEVCEWISNDILSWYQQGSNYKNICYPMRYTITSALDQLYGIQQITYIIYTCHYI